MNDSDWEYWLVFENNDDGDRAQLTMSRQEAERLMHELQYMLSLDPVSRKVTKGL